MKARAQTLGVLLVAGVSAAVTASPADAASPARNGLIAVTRVGPTDVLSTFTITPDGDAGPVYVRTAFGPAFSPDGRTMAFLRPFTGIHAIRANGRRRERVLREAPEDCRQGSLAWSPGGSRLAFTQRCDGAPAMIYTMTLDGNGRPLTEGSQPSWSRRGIAFTSPKEDPSCGDISVMRADGSRIRRLTRGRGCEHSPDWSPDGRRIGFQRGCAIYVMKANGSGVRRVHRAPRVRGYCIDSFAWSPDGRQVVFTLNGPEGKIENGIYAMRADGGRPRPVLTMGGSLFLSIDWQALPPSRRGHPRFAG